MSSKPIKIDQVEDKINPATKTYVDNAVAGGTGGSDPLKEDKSNKGIAGGYAPLDGNAQVPLVNLPPLAPTVPDADATTKGILMLAGDLGGTASDPTVPALATKASITYVDNQDATTLTDANTYTDTKIAAIPSVDISGKENISNKTDAAAIIGSESSTSLYASLSGFTGWIKNTFPQWVGQKFTAIVDNDSIVIGDSEDAFKTKTRTFGQIKATLKAYYDTIYGMLFIVTNVQTGTAYVLQNSDNGIQIETTNAAPVIITVNTGLTMGFNTEVLQQGAGQVSVVAGAGITLRYNSFEVPTTVARYSSLYIETIAGSVNEFKVYGQLTSI